MHKLIPGFITYNKSASNKVILNHAIAKNLCGWYIISIIVFIRINAIIHWNTHISMI